MEQAFWVFVEQVGFPAAVAIFLLWHVLKVQGAKLDKLVNAFDCVKKTLERLLYIEERKIQASPLYRPEVKEEIAAGTVTLCPPKEKEEVAAA